MFRLVAVGRKFVVRPGMASPFHFAIHAYHYASSGNSHGNLHVIPVSGSYRRLKVEEFQVDAVAEHAAANVLRMD